MPPGLFRFPTDRQHPRRHRRYLHVLVELALALALLSLAGWLPKPHRPLKVASSPSAHFELGLVAPPADGKEQLRGECVDTSKPLPWGGGQFHPSRVPLSSASSVRRPGEAVLSLLARSDVVMEGLAGMKSRLALVQMRMKQIPHLEDGHDDSIRTISTNLLKALKQVEITAQLALANNNPSSSNTTAGLAKLEGMIASCERYYAECRRAVQRASSSSVSANCAKPLRLNLHVDFGPERLFGEGTISPIGMGESTTEARIAEGLWWLKKEMDAAPSTYTFRDMAARLSLATLRYRGASSGDVLGVLPPLLPELPPWHFQRSFLPYSSWKSLHSSRPLSDILKMVASSKGTCVVLGSGWGEMLLYLTHTFPAMKVVGYEVNRLFLEVSQRLREKLPADARVEYHGIDSLEADLRKGDVFFLNIPDEPVVRARMYAKLLVEAKAGAIVIDSASGFLGWGKLGAFFEQIQRMTIKKPFWDSQEVRVFKRKKLLHDGKDHLLLQELQSDGFRELHSVSKSL